MLEHKKTTKTKEKKPQETETNKQNKTKKEQMNQGPVKASQVSKTNVKICLNRTPLPAPSEDH